MTPSTSTSEQCVEFAFFCDKEGRLTDVIENSALWDSLQAGASLATLLDSGSLKKAETFFSIIQAQGAAFDWELNVRIADQIRSFHFAGGRSGERVLVVGATSRAAISRTFDRVASERGLSKGSVVSVLAGSSQSDDDLYCEMSRLNNELVNAQRELAKKNAEVEQRVEERTSQLTATLARVELEARTRAEAEQRMCELSARLLRLQDEERRRIARDLHDTTGQTLAALKMVTASLHNLIGEIAPAEPLFQDIDSLTDQALKEIRTTSHLLHPPLLDEAGFASAARWYVEGFSKRSGVDVKLEIAVLDRLPQLVEIVLFRVLQESLTNVIRHSQAQKAEVSLTGGEQLVLSIRDYGKGISSERIEEFERTGGGVGVGLAGMRERAREIGGKLEIQSDERGTTVSMVVPRLTDFLSG